MTSLTHRNPVIIEKTDATALVVKNDGGSTMFSIDSTSGNLTVAGTVDGVDVAALGTSGVTSLTSGEVTQLQNIDSVTISNTQWGYLGAADQAIATTDTVTFAAATVNGNITVTGTVDGIDIATQDAKLVDLHDTIGLSALTSGEVDQLENINSVTISNTQWGYLGSTDQALATTDGVQFDSVSINTSTVTGDSLRLGYNAGNATLLFESNGGSSAADIAVNSSGHLVLRNADSTNPFINVLVDDSATNDGRVSIQKGALHIGDTAYNVTPDHGILLQTLDTTFTDNVTAASGTATVASFAAFKQPTLAATNASVTTTTAATMYIADAPTAGTNQTITTSYALWVDSGNVKFDGDLTVDGSVNFTSSEFNSLVVDGTSTEAFLVRKDADGGDMFTIDTSGEISTFQTRLIVNDNSSKAFLVEDDSGTDIFFVDTNAPIVTSEARLLIDVNSTEAILIRKDADGGDVFAVDTVSNIITAEARLIIDINSTEAINIRKDSDGGDVFIVDTVNDEVETGTSTVVKVTNSAAATSGSTGALQVTGGIATNANSYFDANLDVAGNVTVTGDLTVNGTTTTVDTQTLSITDNFGEFNAGPSGSADAGVLFKRYQTISDAGTDGDVTGDAAEESGTAQAGGSATTIVLAAGANASDDYYNGWWIKITGGTANNNIRRIKDYVGSTKTATIFSTADETATAQTPPTGADFTASPDATSTYELYDCSYGSMFFDESAMEFVFACVSTDPNTTVSPIRYTGLHVKSITSEDAITLSSGMTSEGLVTIDITDPEAFLVRKNGDGGDVFIVDTTNDTVEVTGSITVTGTVDGIDIATQDAKLVDLHDTIGLSALTSAEVDQLENIGATTISATQWGYLGSSDQAIATTDNVQFNTAIVDGTSTEALLVRKDADGGDVFIVDTANSEVYVNGISITPSTGTIGETSFSAANNQSSAANVTGFTFAEASVRSFVAYVSVSIDATADLYEQFQLRGVQKATGTWVLASSSLGDVSNVAFSITSSGGNGQIQYTSGNEAGFVSSTFKFATTYVDSL